MSHVATVQHQFLNLSALSKAAVRCGMMLVEGQQSFRNYANRRTPCDHALRVVDNPQAWEIGVKAKVGDQGREYELLYDGYAGGAGLIEHTRNEHGPLNRLITYYEEEAALEQYELEGWMVERTVLADGTVELLGCR